MPLPQTTTKSPLFEPPEAVLNEAILAEKIALPINAQNFTTLIATNFLIAMAARDRKVTRQYFEDILVTTFNFQNRLVRIAELCTLRENLESRPGYGATDIGAEVDRHMTSAKTQQATLLQTLKLFGEMRKEGDPVS